MRTLILIFSLLVASFSAHATTNRFIEIPHEDWFLVADSGDFIVVMQAADYNIYCLVNSSKPTVNVEYGIKYRRGLIVNTWDLEDNLYCRSKEIDTHSRLRITVR